MASLQHWFRPKRVGWGWTPASWEGWTLTIVVVLSLVGSAVVAGVHG